MPAIESLKHEGSSKPWSQPWGLIKMKQHIVGCGWQSAQCLVGASTTYPAAHSSQTWVWLTPWPWYVSGRLAPPLSSLLILTIWWHKQKASSSSFLYNALTSSPSLQHFLNNTYCKQKDFYINADNVVFYFFVF